MRSVTFWLVTNVQSDLMYVKSRTEWQYKGNSACLPNLHFSSTLWKDRPLLSHQDQNQGGTDNSFSFTPVSLQSPKQCHFTSLLSIVFIHSPRPSLLPAWISVCTALHFLPCLYSILPTVVIVLYLNCKDDHVSPCLNVSVVPIALRRKPEHHLSMSLHCLSLVILTYSFPSLVGPASMSSAHLEDFSPAWLILLTLMFQDSTQASPPLWGAPPS